MLLEELDDFKGKFNCLYLPYDFENGGNKGYAFINFIHSLHILLFYEKFQNKTWTRFESKKICELNLANFQGIQEIKKHAKNYKGLKKPIFFDGLDPKKNLEVPIKYLNAMLKKFPKMTYEKKKDEKSFLIKELF